jgi:hypothetical protein
MACFLVLLITTFSMLTPLSNVLAWRGAEPELRCPPPSHKGGNEEEREKPEKEPYIFE